MKNYFLIMILISGCLMKNPMPDSQITQAIPSNSDLIIKFYDINKVYQKLESLKWWGEMKATNIIDENLSILNQLNEKYKLNELFNEKIIYLSSVLVGGDKPNFLFITSISEIQAKTNKLIRAASSGDNSPRLYEGVTINNIKINSPHKLKTNIFFTVYNEVFSFKFF